MSTTPHPWSLSSCVDSSGASAGPGRIVTGISGRDPLDRCRSASTAMKPRTRTAPATTSESPATLVSAIIVVSVS